MFNEQTKTYISGLRDAELLEYVLTGRRMYEAEAVAFAREELVRRAITPEQVAVMRPAIVERLARYDMNQPLDASHAGTSGIVCSRCGFEVPNRYAAYEQNIGAIVIHFHTSVTGHFCRSCHHRVFLKTTAITLFFGWWGFLSFFFTLAWIPTNIVTLLKSFSIPRRPANATQPYLDDLICARIESQIDPISNRLDEGADIADIAREVAPSVDATPGQVWLFIQSKVRAKAESLEPIVTHGFPVIVKDLQE